MKKIIKSLLILSIFTFSLNAATKIATYEMQRVESEWVELINKTETLQSTIQPITEEIEIMNQEIQEIIADLREASVSSQNPALDQEAKNASSVKVAELQAEYQKKEAEINDYRQRAQELYQTGQTKELNPLRERFMEVIKEICIDEKIDIIIDANTVPYSSEKLDISDKIISVLNKQ